MVIITCGTGHLDGRKAGWVSSNWRMWPIKKWLFLRTCWVFQVNQHHITSAAVVERTKTVLQQSHLFTWEFQSRSYLTHKASIFLWGLLRHVQAPCYIQVPFCSGQMFPAVKTIKYFLSEFSYSHPLLLAKQSIPLAMDSASQMNCGKSAGAQMSHPARSLLAGLLNSTKEGRST